LEMMTNPDLVNQIDLPWNISKEIKRHLLKWGP